MSWITAIGAAACVAAFLWPVVETRRSHPSRGYLALQAMSRRLADVLHGWLFPRREGGR